MKQAFILETKNLAHQYTQQGKVVSALHDISLEVPEGEFVTLLGPSGCGKSTLLKILAGLLPATHGSVVEQKPSADSWSEHGFLFQQYNLFPWLTVAQNIEFGLKMLNVPDTKRQELVAHYLKVVGLNDFAHTYPKELSGGMQQRVALARMFATNPSILFMDEPFTALDMQTKRLMQDLLLQIWGHEPRTVIFVTHDVDEAIFLSDTIYIMSPRPGTIVEKISVSLPRPRDLHTEFSPEFIQLKRRIQSLITRESLDMVKLDLDVYKDL